MTEYGAPFDGVILGDASVAPYSAAEWARLWKLQQGAGTSFPNYGVFAGSGDGTHQPLEVDATAIVSSNVQVQLGAAMVDGRFYETTAVVTLAITANVSGNARIDTVILRLDYASQTIRLVVKQGTPAASPARVAMQQDATYWEIPLADIAVANGFATLAQSTISQRQRIMRTQSMGWQPFAFPQYYSFGATESSHTVAAAKTMLIPIALQANMLLQEVAFSGTIATPYQWGWDLYVQDTNDGNTSENTIRRIAQSNGDASGALGNTILYLAALGAPVPLTPGMYWLAFQNRHAANNLGINVKQIGTFESNVYGIAEKVTSNPNGATLDAVTGWTNNAIQQSPVIVMRGRIFGMTTTYVP